MRLYPLMKFFCFLSLILSISLFAGEKPYPFCPLILAEPQPSTGWFSSGKISPEDAELARIQNDFLARINDSNSNNVAKLEYASWLKTWKHPYARFLELEMNFEDEMSMDRDAYALLSANRTNWYAPLIPEYVSNIEMYAGVIHSVTVELKSVLQVDKKNPIQSKLERLLEKVPTLKRIDFLVDFEDRWIFESFEGAYVAHFAPGIPDSALALQLNAAGDRTLILSHGSLPGGRFMSSLAKGKSSWSENPFIVYLKNLSNFARDLNRQN